MFPSWKLSIYVQIFCTEDILSRGSVCGIDEIRSTSVEFSLDNIRYREVDGILKGSALDPTIVEIFAGFHEMDLISKYKAPEVYFGYEDDIFLFLGMRPRLVNFLTFK